MSNENVVDGRTRFQRAAAARAGSSFEERLARTARVPLADRPVMATNLGRLAERIDRANPLAGAKAVVQQSGHEGLWEKRKRFIRLPSEEAPPADGSGDYGSSGGTYLQLARSAGKLLATNESPDAVDREQERSVRALVTGTSFLPSYTPLSKSDRTAKSLLDEYASFLLTAIKERTRIVDLWAVLRDTPIDLDARGADEERFELTYGGAEKLPDALLRPIFRDHVIEAIFEPHEESGYGFEWQHPSVELGFIAITVETSLFVIPEETATLFHVSREDEDGYLPEKAIEWIRSLDGKRDVLPDEPFDRTVGYGWKPAKLSILRKVGLNVAEGDEGQPRLRLSLWPSKWGDNAVAYSAYGSNGYLEDRIVGAGGKSSQLRSIDVDVSHDLYDYLVAVYSEPVSEDQIGSDAQVIGLLPTWWDAESDFTGLSEGGWWDDPLITSLLLDGKHRFIPTISGCEPVAGPLRCGTLGAALLNNALSAADSDKVSNQLIEKTALTADAGLRFHEAMVDRYRDALRSI